MGDPIIRKNMSIHPSELAKIKTLIEKNNGNLSGSLRESLLFTGFVMEKVGSLERAKEIICSNLSDELRIGDQVVLRVERVTENERMHGDTTQSATPS